MRDRHNPFGYRFLWFQTALFAIQNFGQAYWAFRDMQQYMQWIESPPFALYVGVSLVWGTLFAKLTWAFWRRRQWAIRRLWLILSAYAVFSWVWLWVFADAPNLPFVIRFTVVVLVVDWLLIRRRNMQRFFDPAGEYI
ncbi:MAG: hypothetical protein L0154_04490 [Chloroflexi bacterium]|nr:hypothetical protein [Chloroflexota bacterium]